MIVDTTQVWTMIGSLTGVMGVFSAIMIATFTMLGSSLLSEVRSEIRSLKSDIEVRFGTVDARFDAVDVRLTALESDMHLVKAHLIGQRPA